ncbi:MAG: alpha/beta-type small acid-soluble spore protein [Firmicutes bacterium]|nr:alpha/beta-type small acid-soluble spore protein [Bacillota bacterium]
MARGSGSSNRALVMGAAQALDNFKNEVASELGLQGYQDGYWGEIASRDCGAVGGHMVRRMIQLAEQQIAQGNTNLPKA